MREKKSQVQSFKKPIIISASLHALLIVVLLWGSDFSMSTPQPSGNLVQAVVIDPAVVRQQAQQIRSQRQEAAKREQDRLDKLRRESERLEKNRKAEEERIRQLKEKQAKEAKAARDAEKERLAKEKQRKAEEQRVAKLEAERKAKEQAIKKAEQERKAKQVAAEKAEQARLAREKAAQEAEEKARRQKEAAKKAEQERVAKEKAAKAAAEKARKEKERLERLKRERKEQEAALDDIFSGLESESQANSSAQSRFLDDERGRYTALYRNTIQQYLLTNQSFNGKECRVNIRLVPTGGTKAIVSSAKVLSGDASLCRAAKAAIAQAKEFDFPQDPQLQSEFRDFNFTFTPRDL